MNFFANLRAIGSRKQERMSLWGWAISGWLYRTTRRAREHHDRPRRQFASAGAGASQASDVSDRFDEYLSASFDEAIAEYQRRHAHCLDMHGEVRSVGNHRRNAALATRGDFISAAVSQVNKRFSDRRVPPRTA